jgi:Uncharacterized ABC-type transport system, permease components
MNAPLANDVSHTESPPGPTQYHNLRDLLDAIEKKAKEQDTICIDDILQLVGRRWYGPLLFVAGLVMMMPIVGDIPGVPVMMGLVVILISIQLLWKRKRVWLPRWICERRVASEKVIKGLRWFKKPAHFVDQFTDSRFEWAVQHAGLTMVALMSMMVAAVTPLLELIPFSATLAGFAIATFGISVLAADGIVAFIAIAFSVTTLGLGGYFVLGN